MILLNIDLQMKSCRSFENEQKDMNAQANMNAAIHNFDRDSLTNGIAISENYSTFDV